MIPYMVGKLAPNLSHLTRRLVKYVPGRGYFCAVPSQNGDKSVTPPPPPPIVELVRPSTRSATPTNEVRDALAGYNEEALWALVATNLPPRVKIDQCQAYDAIMNAQGSLRSGVKGGFARLLLKET